MTTVPMVSYRKTCEECNSSYSARLPDQKFCSGSCRKRKELKNSGRFAYRPSIATGTIGAITEMAISVDLMRREWAVFRALSPACFCDLIACKGGTILKIEARTAYRHEKTGKLSFPPKIHDDADIFALYVQNGNEIVYLGKNRESIEI